MTRTVAIKGMAAIEHAQADGRFVIYEPGEPACPRIKAGDRLRVHLAVSDLTWIYAVSVTSNAVYTKLGAWSPGEHAASGVRLLWPGGRVLTPGDAAMATLIVVASADELPWLTDLVSADCSALENKMPPEPPITACDHLYGLFWKIPGRVRGIVPPEVDVFQDGDTRIPAIVAEHRGAPYTAIEWPFMPRA
jgi:hypothetical protein